MVRRFCEALHVDAPPKTRYARNGGVHLAYQQVGDGALDIVEIESWVHHVEAFWAIPELARQRRRLAAIGRLILLDRRGTGLSDPVALDRLPDLETQVQDVIAVMDDAGCEQAAIIGFQDGGALALQLAAAYPERCRALVLWNTAARFIEAVDYAFGAPERELLDLVERQGIAWADGNPGYLRALVPSRVDDARFIADVMQLSRSAVSPG